VRFDPGNQQILRDLAMLQVQVRDLGGFSETRTALLNVRPQLRANWLALAVAHHLAGSQDVAVEVLRAWEGTQESSSSSSGGGGGGGGGGGQRPKSNYVRAAPTPQELSDAYEASELVLYRATLLREAGRPKEALAWLRERRGDVRDGRGLAALEAACLLEAAEAAGAGAGAAGAAAAPPSSSAEAGERASLRQEAAKAYRAMLQDNADDLDAHRGLRCALGLLPEPEAAAAAVVAEGDDDGGATAAYGHGGAGGGAGAGAHEDAMLTDAQRDGLRKLYAGLRAEFPRSGAVGRAPLDFECGASPRFAAAAEAYVRRPLERGVPSLFSDLRPLYADAAKAEALGALMERLRAAVEKDSRLPAAAAEAADDAANNNNGSSSSSAKRKGKAGGKTRSGDDYELQDDEVDDDQPPPPRPTGWLRRALKKGKRGNDGGDEASAGAAAGGDEEEDDGGVQTWTLHYLSQHYDELGRTEDALAASDAAMASSGGRVPELWLARARALKRAGDAPGAAAAAARASALEPSDRYLNSMAARYLLSAGDVVTAQRAAGVFTRDANDAADAAAAAAAAAPGDPAAASAAAAATAASAAASLAEMQHSWFELREGEARLQQGDLGRALKHFCSVAAHFSEFVDDQLDFHQWCLRRSTLRQYVSLVRLADRVRAHPQHARAVWGAVRAYCALADAKEAAREAANGGGSAAASGGKEGGKEGGGGGAAGAAQTPEERKKEQLRRKKAQKAAERAEAEKQEQKKQQQQTQQQAAGGSREASGGGGGGGGSKQQRAAAAAAKPADPDPDGAKLAGADDSMAEAAKLVRVLAEHAPDRLITQRCAFETYLRRGKPVLALAAAERAAAAAGPRHPEAFRMAARLALALCCQTRESSPCAAAAAKSAVVGEVVREGVARLLAASSSASAAAAAAAAAGGGAPGGGAPGGGGARSSLAPAASLEAVRAFVDAYAKAADAPAPAPRPPPSAPGAGPRLGRPSPLDARAGRADDPCSSALARRLAAAEMTAAAVAAADGAGRGGSGGAPAEALALLPELGAAGQQPLQSHADCVAVHRALLPPATASSGEAGGGGGRAAGAAAGPLADAAAAGRWRARAAELYPWSAYFGGAKSGSEHKSGGCNGAAAAAAAEKAR